MTSAEELARKREEYRAVRRARSRRRLVPLAGGFGAYWVITGTLIWFLDESTPAKWLYTVSAGCGLIVASYLWRQGRRASR